MVWKKFCCYYIIPDKADLQELDSHDAGKSLKSYVICPSASWSTPAPLAEKAKKALPKPEPSLPLKNQPKPSINPAKVEQKSANATVKPNVSNGGNAPSLPLKNQPKPSINPAKVEQKNANATVKPNVSNSGNASVPVAKVQSLPPKICPMKGVEAKVETPPEIPKSRELENHDKPKVSPSENPKVSPPENPKVSPPEDPKLSPQEEIGDPKQEETPSSHRLGIFGTLGTARVELVNYQKINGTRLGFIIDEFSGPNIAPDARGFYVIGTESNDLPIKVGDKLLEINRIKLCGYGLRDVSNMLTMCKNNSEFRVSRQYSTMSLGV